MSFLSTITKSPIFIRRLGIRTSHAHKIPTMDTLACRSTVKDYELAKMKTDLLIMKNELDHLKKMIATGRTNCCCNMCDQQASYAGYVRRYVNR